MNTAPLFALFLLMGTVQQPVGQARAAQLQRVQQQVKEIERKTDIQLAHMAKVVVAKGEAKPHCPFCTPTTRGLCCEAPSKVKALKRAVVVKERK